MTLRAVITSVDYSDILRHTLPYNRHHFSEVLVVTGLLDDATKEIAHDNKCLVFATNLFYKDGAIFNKFRAVEAALDLFGREGWLCLLDADILLPKDLRISEGTRPRQNSIDFSLRRLDGIYNTEMLPGILLTPLRRMYKPPFPFVIPDESTWQRHPVHRNTAEWAGYCQIFHTSDPVLGDPPWHQTDWQHAGGADSFFQAKWDAVNKIRPNWEVLHIGEAGTNWFGRASADVNTGLLPPDAKCKIDAYMAIWPNRRERKRLGLDPYADEKIRKS